MAPVTPRYVVGIDVGSEQCSYAILHADKSPLGKPRTFAQTPAGFALLAAQLDQLAAPPAQVLVGLEATGLYWENLYYFLHQRGYTVWLLHPAQTHQFAQQRGLRAKTDRLDATTIARLLLSDEVRPAYVPDEQVASYRELVRLHSALSDEAARYKQELRGLLVLVFPEFSQVFADPSRPQARALLARYPSAAAILSAGPEQLTASLHELAPRRPARRLAAELLALAEQSIASGVARAARERSVRVLCDQLGHVEQHLAELAQEIAALLEQDEGAGGLTSVPEFGPKTVAVLRAELGDVGRFVGRDQAVAYVGLDVTVRQSGKWRGQRKVSKRGSGPLRRILYLAAVRSLAQPGSAFGAYYRHLLAQGVAKMSALMAVMRKMVGVAYRLLKSGQSYDPQKVWAGAKPPPEPVQEATAAA
jgi:transposase